MNIIECLLHYNSLAKWELVGETYDDIIWMDDIKKPSKEELLSIWDTICLEKKKQEYKLLRKEAYPSIGDQLDALYHAGIFPDDMAKQIKQVKDKYPKS